MPLSVNNKIITFSLLPAVHEISWCLSCQVGGDFRKAFSEAKGAGQMLKEFPSKMSSVCSLTCRKGLEALAIKAVFQARDLG